MIKQGDFIEIEYTGKIKDSQMVFDTTVESVAKENDMHDPGRKYGGVVVCIGQGNILPGLEKKLIGKEENKEYTIELSPEEGFGKKSAKLIQLISTSKFRKDNIEPYPGMQVNVDGNIGIVKTVTGGRTLVDFNHPLASKDIVYDVKILRVLTDDLEKAKGYLSHIIGDAEVELNEGVLKVASKNKIPKEIVSLIEKKIKEIIPTINKVEFADKFK
ncbi:MAG: peptidylprolyl isomerase [Candidatus Woesearchaeota archaeon]